MRKVLLSIILLFPSFAWAGFDYDGADDDHYVTDPNIGDTDTLTVCFWLNSGSSVGDGEAILSYGTATPSNTGWTIGIKDTMKLRMQFWGSQYIETAAITASTWTHVCFVKEGTDQATNRSYINGTRTNADRGISTPTIQDSGVDFLIARPSPGEWYGWTRYEGLITHVAYWTSIVSESDISAMAAKTSCPTAINSATLEFFSTMAATPTDSSSNSFTIGTSSAPAHVSDPSGLPCGAPTTTTTTVTTTTILPSLPITFSADFNEGFN